MIECIFTLDYEIYGNGEGSLRDLVYDPTAKLFDIFRRCNVRFVPFVEAAEIEMIEANAADPAIDLIREQIKDLYREGFEPGLHLHPQWYNGRCENGRWQLDYNDYNVCILPQDRIIQIVERAIAYLRNVIGISDFTPLSFRAGNWLFQPTRTMAKVLSEHGIKIDSSVFKGGLQHEYHLDYRGAEINKYFWKFQDNINKSDSNGSLLEIPIYTQMVPFWKMVTTKRISIRQKGPSGIETSLQGINRIRDFLRFHYPLKLDFCRMTINELKNTMDTVIKMDMEDPASFKPIVIIGHTKDLVDFNTVESFLPYLKQRGIKVSTFREVYNKCIFSGFSS